MTDFRPSHTPTQDERTHLFLMGSAISASVACRHLQNKLAALAEILVGANSQDQSNKARSVYDSAVQTAREAVAALRDIQNALGNRRELISTHVRDAEELSYALALLDDGRELNSSHQDFAAVLEASHLRTSSARETALDIVTRIARDSLVLPQHKSRSPQPNRRALPLAGEGGRPSSRNSRISRQEPKK